MANVPSLCLLCYCARARAISTTVMCCGTFVVLFAGMTSELVLYYLLWSMQDSWGIILFWKIAKFLETRQRFECKFISEWERWKYLMRYFMEARQSWVLDIFSVTECKVPWFNNMLFIDTEEKKIQNIYMFWKN